MLQILNLKFAALWLCAGCISGSMMAQTASISDDLTHSTSTLTTDNPFTLVVTGGSSLATITYEENDNGTGWTGPFSPGWMSDDASNFKICGITPSSTASISQIWYVGGSAAPTLSFTRATPVGTHLTIRDNSIQMDPTNMVWSCGPLRSSSVLLIGRTQTFKIQNAAASSTVTYTENGTGPFTAGTTDSSGNFSLANVTVPDSPTSSISQVWKVGGTTLSPNPLVYSRRYPIVADGDSLTVGDTYDTHTSAYVVTPRPYPQALSSAANLGVMGIHSGDVLASHLSTADSYNSSDGTKGHTNGNSRWYVLWIGTNDLLAAAEGGNCLNYQGSSVTCSVAVLEKNVQTIVSDQQTAGFQVMVLNLSQDNYWVTTPCNSACLSTFHSDRNTYNTWLTPSNSGADAVCNVSSALGTAPNANFSADGLHLTQAGYDSVASTVKGCLGW